MVRELRSSDRRTATRSRVPSPNDHGSDDSSFNDENVPADKIRVGRNHQVVCPELEPIEKRRPDLIPDLGIQVWSPNPHISDVKLDEFIYFAKEKYGYDKEQALGMLSWHKHDFNLASLDMANFIPYAEEWTVEDKARFEKAFQSHGKSFHKIRRMMPDRSVASLVKYYYSWKKQRPRRLLDVVGGKAGRTGTSGSGKREDENNEKVNKHQAAPKRKGDKSTESSAKITRRWSYEDHLTAVTAIRKHGKDFQAIAQILGTKTVAHVRTFFTSYRRRYNLDAVLREHEAENTQIGIKRTDNNNQEEVSNQNNGGTSQIKEKRKEVDSDDVTIGKAEQGNRPIALESPALNESLVS